MSGKPGLLHYVAAAFNARPFGMFVAPNWVGLGAFGLLGLVNPGFWVLGAGVELGYLLLLSTNGRFQRLIEARQRAGATNDTDARMARALQQLGDAGRRRYQSLADRCREILELQVQSAGTEPHGLDAQAESLGRLSWMYLRLLSAHHVIEKVLGTPDQDDGEKLASRIARLEREMKNAGEDNELERSLGGQIDILRQRLQSREEGRRKLAYIDAELARIEQQVELIREQAALSTDPESLSRRIDEIAATLGGTAQWIRDQQQVYGAMEDLLSEPPRLTAGPRAKESQ